MRVHSCVVWDIAGESDLPLDNGITLVGLLDSIVLHQDQRSVMTSASLHGLAPSDG